MKKIYKNSDIKFNIDSEKLIGDKFIIKFFTTNKNLCITHNSDDVIFEDETRYIKLNWFGLSTIVDGVLNYICNNLDDDQDFDDDIYNKTFSRTTDYYIASNSNNEENYSDILLYLQNQINILKKDIESERLKTIEDINDIVEMYNHIFNGFNKELDEMVEFQNDLGKELNKEIQRSTDKDKEFDKKEKTISASLNDLKGSIINKEELKIIDCGEY